MSISEFTSISTNVKSFQDVQRVFDELKKKIDELTANQNPTPEGGESDLDGETGSIRIIKNKTEESLFEVKTEDGWQRPVVGETPVTFTNPEKASKTQTKKSIDEIESTDESTGDSKAQKTIYDEKADKFIMARADYDSGWQTWTLADYRNGDDNPLTLTHNLEVLPTNVKIFIAPGQATNAISWVTPVPAYLDKDYKHGICCKITTTQILLLAGRNDSVVSSDFASTSNEQVFDDGSIRVLMWK